MSVVGRTKVAMAAGLAAVILAGIVSTVQRIPPGRLGVSSSRVAPAGWTLHAPFVPLLTIPAHGALSHDDVELRTTEGSTLKFKLELRYAIGATVSPQLLTDISRTGFDAAVAGLASRVLSDVARSSDVESLLAEPARVEGPLTFALRGAGIEPESLTLRSGLGEERVRRQRTDEAIALARAPRERILVVGWDGADWRTALPLIAAGRMPNLARLVREGASGNLRSYDPMFSPLLWTTVATGKPPTDHGIADFLVKDGATGVRHPITSDFRKVKALWNIFGDFGRSSCWLGWWASYPAETIQGAIVTDYLAAAVTRVGPEAAAAIPGIASPPSLLRGRSNLLIGAAQITRDDVSQIMPVTEAEYRDALLEIAKPPKKGASSGSINSAAFVMRVQAQARTLQNVALEQLRSGVPFVAVYYEAIDMMGHSFQQYLPPKMSFVSESDFQRFRDAVPNFYAWQDVLLGELLAAAGRDTITVVLSDHGFRTGDDRPNFAPSITGQPEEWHRDWGIVLLHGPGILLKRLLPSSIFDIAPTLLYLNGLPLAADMPGRLIAEALDAKRLASRPPSKIPSYELVGGRLEHSASVQADPEVMNEMMANLKALGYVGGSDEAPAKAPDVSTATNPLEGGTVATTQYFFHRNLAVSYMRQRRFRDAEGELLLANERQPRGKTYAMLSEARASQGRFADAAAALEEGWQRLPKEMDPSSLLWIVELHLLAADRNGATAAADRWSTNMSPAVHHAIEGRLAEASGDTVTATSHFHQALEADPLLVRVALRLQSLEASAGRPFAMESFLTATLQSHPDVDAYWDLAGQLALAHGDLSTAIARFQHATDIEPENAVYLGHLATAQAATGDSDGAREALGWSERFPPVNAEGWMALGAAWDRLGETERAVAAFGKARESSGAGPGADLGTALALARAGRTAEARRVLEDGLRRYPESAALRQLATRLGD